MERDDESTTTTTTTSTSTTLTTIEEGEQELNDEAFADMAMSLELPALPVRPSEAPLHHKKPKKLSAYEQSRNGTVHYSRREDKIRALQAHPIVAFVAPDGRTVGCKCGRNVRLNPPWYILKFEQHVASRNCSFLRQPRGGKKRKRNATSDDRNETEKEQEMEEKEEEESAEYALTSIHRILEREFGVVENGRTRIVPPPSESTADARVRMYQGAMALRDHPHFQRITPDGRFVECKCSRIVLLHAPWQPGQFFLHVADKQKPTKRMKHATTGLTLTMEKKKHRTPVTKSSGNGGMIQALPSTATTCFQLHQARKSFPREIRWDVARARGFLPCPGLRDERMHAFVTSAVQLTGGARHRLKIARELFPHLFTQSIETDPTVKARDPPLKLQHQLLEAEKLLLHDAMEGEALWFVDKDGNSVRSLYCLGMIEASKGDVRCASCTALRSNATLRAAVASKLKLASRKGPARNPINRKFCSGRVCSLLEAEFDMREPFARVLRDLALAEIPGALNPWMEMATMGLSGDFDTHPALLGLTEAMVRFKEKEQRGVGLQNMTYSSLLDTFMRSLAELSPEACDLFQKHLGGRRQQRPLMGRCTKRQSSSDLLDENREPSMRGPSDEGFVHLLGLTMPPLSISDIQDVDLSPFPPSTTSEQASNASCDAQDAIETLPSTGKESCDDSQGHEDISTSSCIDETTPVVVQDQDQEDETDEPGCSEENSAVAFLSEVAVSEESPTRDEAVIPRDHVPCTGLRDQNVQAYVANAVQIVGGSRPRYVIARELYPRVFGNDKKVRMVDKLSDAQRLVLQDAVFSECLWRVDKEGRCVRSLRCKRFVPAPAPLERVSSPPPGVCRACRDLRTVPNFRSVLSRSKVPKNLENIKYVPSVYTESDPFLRKLSKNGAFRRLYQCVKRLTTRVPGDEPLHEAARLKHVHFWLRFARLGVLGQFQSHPVFEGLMKSMVEVKDKERRGVGKQNMQYTQALDEFLQQMVQLSVEAFELFAAHFCGRTLRSQKVKRRLKSPTVSMIADGGSNGSAVVSPVPQTLTTLPYLLPPDDLLSDRSLSSEESQRFMDRMLDEVRLAAAREAGGSGQELVLTMEEQLNEDEDNRVGPETFLNEEGVLTTQI